MGDSAGHRSGRLPLAAAILGPYPPSHLSHAGRCEPGERRDILIPEPGGRTT